MEEVVVSPPVQECVDMEVDKVEGDANLTELKKPKKRRRLKSKKKLLVKGEDTENPNTTLGAIASVDQEMIVTSPAANGDGKSSISSTNAPDKTASHDIISPAATADQKMIVLTPAAATVDGKSSISSTNAPDKTASQDICRPPATADQNMIVLNPADTVDGKSSISSTNAPDKTASHDILGPAAIVDQQMTVLSPAPVQECLVVETDKDEVSAKVTTRKKNRRRKLKIQRNKNLESLDKREGTENPGSLGEIASVDPKMMVLSSAATVEEKSSIPSTNATDQIASGDILSTKVHEAVTGEMSSGKTVADSTTSKKRKRNQRAKKTVAGDVLSAKVDEIVSGETVPYKAVTDNTRPKKKRRKKSKKKVGGDVLSAKVNEVVSGEMVSSKTTTNNTTPKKKKRNKKKRKLKTVAGDILSTCENIESKVNATEGSSATEVTEAISGEMVLGKTALPDVKMVSKEEEHAEAANGKMGSSATANLNVNGAVNSCLTIGEILTPQNLQSLKAENGETGPGTTAADTTASKKKKSPLSGDILSTSENIQDKVNAIDGLSTTKVLDTKITNKTELSDITNHNVDDKKGPEVVNTEIGASNTTSKQKTKKQKVDVNPSENEEITKATPGIKLVIFELDGMLADIVFPSPKDVEADKYSHGEAVFKRPYLDDFLSFCFEKFNVGIWSSRMKKKNLDPVVDCLFGDLKKKLLFTWSGFHCRNSGMRTIEDRDKFIVFKELRNIWEKNGPSWVKGTFNESNTLLLDDSPYKALLNPKHTGFFPTSYKYTDTNDDCLGFNMEIWRKFVNELHELLVNSDWDQLSMGTDIVCMECGKDMVPELREKGICMNKENFGTYEAMDSYAREHDIAGAKEMECGWIYE
ncbi:FCP1-like domain, HAD-like domain protein [Artemisia annua]|uniref:FCP1-like domain, HAD-like domain protein n=1 Tax=Artemisia annua TaxID=35608 RepID=A0A2U1LRP1_ARTAN|nr:FCP1-like domain, HAD-like domain protein [Artemisia annua]